MHAHEAAPAEPYVVRKATSDDVGAVARIWHIGWGDGHIGRPISYLAETEIGPLAVPSHRYEIDLSGPVSHVSAIL